MTVARLLAAAATGGILVVMGLRAVEGFLHRFMPDRKVEE
jgi:hypothetical protein